MPAFPQSPTPWSQLKAARVQEYQMRKTADLMFLSSGNMRQLTERIVAA